MATRSTRNKIKHQSKEGLDAVDRIFVTLENLDMLAAGRSVYITENLPMVVESVKFLQDVLKRFREGL